MPRRVRALIQDLRAAGFDEIRLRGKGSPRLFSHPRVTGVVTLSGADGDDAKPYQERHVRRAIEAVQADQS